MESKNILTALDNIAEAINNGGGGSSSDGGNNSESSVSNDLIFPIYILKDSTAEASYTIVNEKGNEVSLLFDEILNAYRSNKIVITTLYMQTENSRDTMISLDGHYKQDKFTEELWFYIFFNYQTDTHGSSFVELRLYPDTNGKAIVEEMSGSMT